MRGFTLLRLLLAPAIQRTRARVGLAPAIGESHGDEVAVLDGNLEDLQQGGPHMDSTFLHNRIHVRPATIRTSTVQFSSVQFSSVQYA